MLLTIHGLPYSTKYQDLKQLIKDKCNISDFILDNLVSEGSNAKKVRIGLTDDGDGKLLIKCLDGMRLSGSLLRVVPVSKNQPANEPLPFDGQRNIKPAAYNDTAPYNSQTTEPDPWRNTNQWQGDSRQTMPYNDNYNSQANTFSAPPQLITPRVEIPQLNLNPSSRDAFPKRVVVQPELYKPQPPALHPTRTAALREIQTVDSEPSPSAYQPASDQFQKKPLTINKDNFQGPQSARNLRVLQQDSQQKSNIPTWGQPQPSFPVRDNRALLNRSGGYPPMDAPMADARRQSPPRRPNDGRRMSPVHRPLVSPGRKNSPPRRNIDRAPERYSPPHRVVDDSINSRPRYDRAQPPVSQTKTAPNQAMYGDGFRTNVHENVQYPTPGGPRTQTAPWHQFGPKPDNDRRPKFEPRALSPRKSRSPVRRERSPLRRDRSPLKDRLKRHSPSPRSPRRSWALEKRRSPEANDAPPPPVWPGQKEDAYPPNKPVSDKFAVMWDRNKYDEIRSPESESMREVSRMGAARPVSPYRRQMYKPEEPRFEPPVKKPPQAHRPSEDDRKDYRQPILTRGDARDYQLDRPQVRNIHKDDQNFQQPAKSDLHRRDEEIVQKRLDTIKRREMQPPRYEGNKPVRVSETLDKELEDIYKRTAEFKKKAEEFRHAEERRKEEERRKDLEFQESLRHNIERDPPRDRDNFRRDEQRPDKRRFDDDRKHQLLKNNDRDMYQQIDHRSNPEFNDTKMRVRNEEFKGKSIPLHEEHRDFRDERRDDRNTEKPHERRNDRREDMRDNRREDIRDNRRDDTRDNRRDDIRDIRRDDIRDIRRDDIRDNRREDRRDDRRFDKRDDRRDERRVDRRDEKRDDQRDTRIDQQRKQIQTLLREKACSEIAERILDHREDINWKSDIRLQIKEELRQSVMSILNNMFNDKDASFIEYTVKFRAYYDARAQDKLFYDVVAKVNPVLARPAPGIMETQQSSRHGPEYRGTKEENVVSNLHVPGITDWDIAPADSSHLLQPDLMQPMITAYPSQFMPGSVQPHLMQVIGVPQVETIPQLMVPQREEINLYLCKDDFECFNETQLEYLRKFLFCEMERESQISNGWAPDFSFKPMQSLHRYELKTYDEKTRDWIMNIDFTKFTYFNVLIYNKEELWYERAAIWLPGHSRCKMEPLNKIKLQNRMLENVKIEQWKLVKKIVTDKGTRIYVDMPPASARGLEKHKMMLSYELQKVNVFLKAIAVDKETFDAGLLNVSINDPNIILNAAQNCTIPILSNDPKLVKLFIKGKKTMTVGLARKIKEMLIYQIYKYHQQKGKYRTDFLKFGICPPNFFAVLPENEESRKFLMNVSIGKLNGAPIVVVGKDVERSVFFAMNLVFPRAMDRKINIATSVITERLKTSNWGVKGLNFKLWKSIPTRKPCTLVYDVDMESAETIVKLNYTLDYAEYNNNVTVDVKPEMGKLAFEASLKKYKMESADIYEETNMDISYSESEDDVICLD